MAIRHVFTRAMSADVAAEVDALAAWLGLEVARR